MTTGKHRYYTIQKLQRKQFNEAHNVKCLNAEIARGIEYFFFWQNLAEFLTLFPELH